jgi:hypothetical protein
MKGGLGVRSRQKGNINQNVMMWTGFISITNESVAAFVNSIMNFGVLKNGGNHNSPMAYKYLRRTLLDVHCIFGLGSCKWRAHLCVSGVPVSNEALVMSRNSVRRHVERLIQELEVGHVMTHVNSLSLFLCSRLPPARQSTVQRCVRTMLQSTTIQSHCTKLQLICPVSSPFTSIRAS